MSKPHVFCTKTAVREARRLGVLPAVGELTANEAANLLAFWVRGLILDGSLGWDRADPTGRLLFAFGDAWKARLEQKRSVLRPGRYWSVVGCEAHDGGKIAPSHPSRPEPSQRGGRAPAAVGAASGPNLAERIEALLRQGWPLA